MTATQVTAALLVLLLAGCPKDVHPGDGDIDTDVDTDTDTGPTDADGDGWTLAGGDCDDADPAVHPGADEWCDSVDSDCDGRSYDDHSLDASTWYLDDDWDGYGDPKVSEVTCVAPSRYVAKGTDCDDADPAVNPGAKETCDGIDNDCDGVADGSPWCEDCTNGLDDDEDALVDCEDGDCTDVEPCEETVCADGLDGDGDGLVDCDDDDCWGPACHPAGVRARAWGGTFEEAYRHQGRAWHGCCGWYRCAGHTAHDGRELLVHSVRGTVQVLPPGAISWDATTARTTCAWSMATATLGAHYDLLSSWSSGIWGGGRISRFYPHDIVRAGLVVEPGCRLAATSWFLPDRIIPGCVPTEIGRILPACSPFYSPCAMGFDLGPVWYAGCLGEGTGTTMTDSKSSSTSYCLDVRTRTWSRHWRYSGVLDPGSVYTALP